MMTWLRARIGHSSSRAASQRSSNSRAISRLMPLASAELASLQLRTELARKL